MLFDHLKCSGNEFLRVDKATERARVPTWFMTLGTDNKWNPDERSILGFGGRESMENRSDGSPEERVWWTVVHSLKMMPDCTRSQWF